MEKIINIPGIGEFVEKYQLLSCKMDLTILGKAQPIEVRFNVIDNDGHITENQIKAYHSFMNNLTLINHGIISALKDYKAKYNITNDANVTATSVVFDSDESYILLNTSWDIEEGLAAIFNSQGCINIVNQDEVL